jgi:uncharacterized membrane protein YfcA
LVDLLTGSLFALLAGMVGGAMNALAGGGTFVTLPALIALGLPSNIANATSNFALLPGACSSAWVYRHELRPLGGVSVWALTFITFVGGLAGGILLVITPTHVFDVLVPWLLLFAFLVMLFGLRASQWLHSRVTIGPRTLVVAQVLLGVYGGYFGGGVGLIMTAVYGLLASSPRVLRAGGEAQALGAARHGGEVDRLHIGAIFGEQDVADLLGLDRIADHQRHDVRDGGHHRQARPPPSGA